jgi:hypothetical protein
MIVELGSAAKAMANRMKSPETRLLRSGEIPPNPPLIKGGERGISALLVKNFRIVQLGM